MDLLRMKMSPYFGQLKTAREQKGLLAELILHDITMNIKCIGANWQAHTGLIQL